jgi:diguanylate cyclase (GGDEF)-like protein
LDLDRTLEHLIRRLVADAKDGFAAHVTFQGAAATVAQSRGLSEKARKSLVIDAGLLQRVAKEGVVMLRKAELYGYQVLASLPAAERARVDRLFLAGLGDDDPPSSLIISTSLLPVGAPLDQQIELVRRLMQGISGIVRRTTELAARDRELQSMNEIMELRAVTDRRHTSPLDMIEAFLDRLREMTKAERAVVFLVAPDGGSYKPLCRCGIPLAAGAARLHADYEVQLAETAVGHESPAILDAAQLSRLGIASVIGSAVVAPVVSPNGIAGALCLTSAAGQAFSTVRPPLIAWAARYLSESLLRALHQTVAEWHARQDSLTDLSNRRTFDRELAAALQSASADGDVCALLMIDIDRFKAVNDRHGHLVGDDVLRAVSRVLKDTVGRLSSESPGIAARFGGEEFAVLLPGVAVDEATWVGESMRTAIELAPIETRDVEIRVTVSVGVALFPEHGTTAEELIAAADAALYQAKDAGRNRVLVASAVAG